MAAGDYYFCDICITKVFYDADVDYPEGISMVVLCQDCAKMHKLIVIREL